MSFTSPKGCNAIKPQFNFIYNLSNLSSIVSPISSMIAPCQLLTENLHSPFIMKMPPENIAIFNHNATVAPSAEPPRITSPVLSAALNDTVKYEDPWEVALVPAEATKFNMLSISRHHQPGHWMAPSLHQRRPRSGGPHLPCCIVDHLVTKHLTLLHCRRPGHHQTWMCSSLKQKC